MTKMQVSQPSDNRFLDNWAVIFYGSKSTMKGEDRGRWVLSQKRVHAISVRRFDPEKPHIFIVDDSPNVVHWDSLSNELSKIVPFNFNKIILDITSLELETILYLVSALIESNTSSVGFMYISPLDYPLKFSQDFKYRRIQQPRGFVTYSSTVNNSNSAHILFLGFDKNRTQKFLQKYNWNSSNVYAAISYPSFVDSGYEKALEVNSLIIETIPGNNLVKVDGVNPFGMRDWLVEMFEKHSLLDIVPVGPKPWTLGMLMFYFGLEDRDRARVRILYDFPTPGPGRSTGVGDIYHGTWNL